MSYFVDIAAFAAPRRRGRRAIARTLTTLLARGWAREGQLRPVMPHLGGQPLAGLEPVLHRVAVLAGPSRKRGNRYDLRLDIEQAVGFLMSGYPNLDLPAIESTMAPWAAALLAARDAKKPQVAKVDRVLVALDSFREACPEQRTVQGLARRAGLNRRPSVVGRYVGLGLLAERVPAQVAATADAKLRRLQRTVIGPATRAARST